MQKIRFSLKKLNDKDKEIVKKIIDKWENKQAISNLLHYPSFIPKEVRFKTIIKALNEQEEKYYQLAGKVGIHSPNKLGFTKEEKEVIKENLFNILENTYDIRFSRGTLTLLKYINKNDTQRIIKCSINRDGESLQNLTVMLSQLHKLENVERMIIENSKGIEKEAKILIKFIDDFNKKVESAPENEKVFMKMSLESPLYGYIPNLKNYN